MSGVIFARPRWDYASYQDFYRLIELSGYPFIFFDEIDPSTDNTYIMTILNGENMGGWVNPRAHIILWDVEWRLDNPANIPGVARVWASDKWYAGKIGAQYVPFGSHPDLASPARARNGRYDYDAAILAYAGPPRRSTAYHSLEERGLRVSGNGWGEERESILQHSRAMVHVHQLEGVNTVAPQRFALCAAWKLPLITETLFNPGIFRYRHLIMSDYANLADIADAWIRRNDPKMLEEFGASLHHLLCCEYPFRACVESAV